MVNLGDFSKNSFVEVTTFFGWVVKWQNLVFKKTLPLVGNFHYNKSLQRIFS